MPDTSKLSLKLVIFRAGLLAELKSFVFATGAFSGVEGEEMLSTYSSLDPEPSEFF